MTINTKQALTTIGVFLALVVSVWGFDAHFVTKGHFDITIQNVQTDRNKDNAFRDVQFWTQQEVIISNMLALTPPNSPRYYELQKQLDQAIAQKAKAIEKYNAN